MNLHVYGKVASLVAKNLLNKTNYFEGKYHGLGVSQYGRNLKEKRFNKRGHEFQILDIDFMLVASLTGEGDEEEVIENFVNVLFKSDLPHWPKDEEGRKNKAKAVKEKYQISGKLYKSILGAVEKKEEAEATVLEEREQALLEERMQSYRETARARLESKQGDEGSVSDYSIPSD
jgi:NACalpha-BTF3-like transcription factor